MTDEKILKIPFAGRMDPELKRELTAEADKRNMTLSSYIELRLKEGKEVEDELNCRVTNLEKLIKTHPLSVYDDLDESEEDEDIPSDEEEEALIDRVEELEAEKSDLEEKVAAFGKENEALKKQLAEQPVNFSPEDLEEAESYFAYIMGKYADLTKEKVVVAALYAEARSLKTAYFSGYSVKDYLNSSREKRMNKFVNQNNE